MPTAVQVQYRRGTASQVASFTGAAGEMVVDTTNNRVVVQDGATAGGWPAAKLSEVSLAPSANTAHGVLIAEGAGVAPTSTAAMSSGQLLIGQGTSSDPSPETVSGDATLSAVGVLTIAASAVSNAKLAPMAASTLKGNNGGSAANAADLTPSQVLAMIGLKGGPALHGMLNGTVAASVASNALTLAVKTTAGADPSASDPVLFFFRDDTLASGDYVVVTVTAALSVTIPSGATLGHASARDQQIILYALNNSGTVELAVACPLLDQSVRLQSTTALSSSATSPSTLYSNTARSNVPTWPIARCVSNQTSAGTWAAAPAKIDLAPFTLPVNECIAELAGGTNQTLAAATWTKINVNTAFYDPDGIADVTANHRIQPKVPGTYAVTANVYMTGTEPLMNTNAAVPAAGASFAKNGTRSGFSLTAVPGAGTVQFAHGLLQMNGTSDYIELQAYCEVASGSVTVHGDSGDGLVVLSCVRVGP